VALPLPVMSSFIAFFMRCHGSLWYTYLDFRMMLFGQTAWTIGRRMVEHGRGRLVSVVTVGRRSTPLSAALSTFGCKHDEFICSLRCLRAAFCCANVSRWLRGDGF